MSSHPALVPRTTLLIVDDEPTVIEMLGSYLETRGYEVRGVGWASEAVEVYRAWRPALVLLDIVLPDESGLIVLRRLRQEDPTARVVVMTAVQEVALRQEALASGASGFAFKPMEVTALDRILRAAAGLNPLGPQGDQPCVMILDDDAEIRVGLRYFLIGCGMEVAMAGSAEEGLSMLRSFTPTPQVLVLDLNLPRLGGMEFLKLVQQTRPELAVIVLTAMGGTTLRETAKRYGARLFLQKPVMLEDLERMIREYLPSPPRPRRP